MIALLLICVVAYLLGSINTSILVSRMYGTDIRKHGSGNAGATNTLRTLGKKAAVMVVVGDAIKGVLAIYLTGFLVELCANLGTSVFENGEIYRCTAGFFAILGHNFPVYFKFQGGKGVLTSAAVIAMLEPVIFLCLLVIFVVIVAITRYVSLGSVCSAAGLILLPVILLGFDHLPFLVFGVLAGASAILMHRGNLVRLKQGTERKLGEKKKSERTG
ncbi:MAG: glycerol-3-phosphate 1-O-acyltransferase PlsY [Ruminococcaceae bacterium]|nr:glycerol-3-phosphate 1-O-acyltransferase PlsY [Oscillospiraceae bacterium]